MFILRWLGYHRPIMPLEPTQERLYTVKEAAERLGKTEQAVRDLIKNKRLPARKFGREWAISESAIDDFEPGRAGRPREKQSS